MSELGQTYFTQALLRELASRLSLDANPETSPSNSGATEMRPTPVDSSELPTAKEGFQIVSKDHVPNPNAIFAIGASTLQWRKRPDWKVGLPPLDLRIRQTKDIHHAPFRQRVMRLHHKVKGQSRGRRRDDLAWNASMKYVPVVDGDLDNQEVRFSRISLLGFLFSFGFVLFCICFFIFFCDWK